LLKYHDPFYRIELRCLYVDGLVTRRQWTFRDGNEVTRMAAVFADDQSGFIELYNADKLIAESHQLNTDGSDYLVYYYYNRGVLIRAETRLFRPFAEEVSVEKPEPPAAPMESDGIDVVPVPRALNVPVTELIQTSEGTEEPIWTDYYRYTRSNALRSVERHYIRSPVPGNETERMRFPQLILGVGSENEFVKPGSVFSSEFFEDVIVSSGDRILYNTDPRGRILSEVRRDENDKILGEVINTWSGDRLLSVLWKSDNEERLIEYEYNAAGDRVFERNLRNNVLERTVRQDGEREIEELYINGEVALRALWIDGRKVSEEPVRPPVNRRRDE
jgi:hypothetical protein